MRAAAVFLTLFWGSTLASAEPPAVVPVKSLDVLAGRELTLPRTKAEDSSVQIHIPVRCNPADAFAGLQLQTLSVIYKGQLLDPATVQLQRDGSTTPTQLLLKVDLKRAAGAGAYTVKVLVTPPDPALPAPLTLDFTLTRLAAELQTISTIQFERTVYIPWVWSAICARKYALTEKANHSVLLLSPENWTTNLQADSKSAGQLMFTLPKSIEPGCQGDLTVKDYEHLPLGKASGTLTIRSPQLAKETVDAPVEVASRLAFYWLIGAIALGIVAGYQARTRLELRRQRELAVIGANERLQALGDTIDKAVDEDLITRLNHVRDTLRDAITPNAAPDTIEAATKTAATAAENILTQAETDRAALRNRIAALRTNLGSPRFQAPSIRALLDNILGLLDTAETELNGGAIGKVRHDLDSLEQELPNRLGKAATDWSAATKTALNRLGNWPETQLPDALQQVRADLAVLDAGNFADNKALLQATLRLGEHLDSSLIQGAVDSIKILATDVLKKLQALKDQSLEPLLGDLDKAVQGLPGLQQQATTGSLQALAEQVHQLGEALTAALQQAFPVSKTNSDPKQPSGLNEGKFLQALQDVLAKRQAPVEERELGNRRRVRQMEEIRESRQQPGKPRPDFTLATWTVTIEAASTPVVGHPLSLRARLTASSGDAVPPVTVRWFVDGKLEKEGVADALQLVHVPRQAGMFVVRVEVTAAGDDRRVKELTLNVRLPEGAAVLPMLYANLRKIERNQSLVFGTLITLTGYVLYQNLFIGTVADLLTAFLWGFTVDVGMAKVRELGVPLVGRFTALGAAGTQRS